MSPKLGLKLTNIETLKLNTARKHAPSHRYELSFFIQPILLFFAKERKRNSSYTKISNYTCTSLSHNSTLKAFKA